MRRSLPRTLVGVLTALVFATHAQAVDTTRVDYRLRMPEPWTHLFEVELSLPSPEEHMDSIDLVLPVWRAGRYVIFDFAGGVVRFEACDAHGSPLRWTKVDKTTWRIRRGKSAGRITARYQVYANEFELRTRGLNEEHGYVDGKAILMYAPEFRSRPTRLTIEPYGTWHVTTAHRRETGSETTFLAADYDRLVDDPVEIGTQTDISFEVDGIPHLMCFSRPLRCDTERLVADVTRIVRMNRAFWGDLPYDRYVFIFHVAPGAGGGTEHMNSSVMGVEPRPFGAREPCSSLLGLISHEFFHTWNVKRLRPKGMDPYDWTKETYFRELWIVEGATSYMHNLLRVREGLTSVESHLEGVAAAAKEERSRPGNRVQSLTECSFDTWIKASRGREQAVNFETNYYARGAQVCLIMDLELRRLSENRTGFGDLLRLLYRRFPLGSGGYTVEDVQAAAVELGGKSMVGFFEAYVYGTDPLPWERALESAGLILTPRDSVQRPWFGLETRMEGSRLVVRQVIAGSPAYRAGITIGDELIAMDGHRMRSETLPLVTEGVAMGATVELVLLRDDLLRSISVTLDQPAPQAYVVRRAEHPTPAQRETFESWVGVPWGTGNAK
jgi:predicted metalloprotease with PDZ domain